MSNDLIAKNQQTAEKMETITIEVESPELLSQIEALLLLAGLEATSTYNHLDNLTADDYRSHAAKRPHRV
jgi:hypothetical protein